PAQADADSDEVGDACDATPRGTTPPLITVALVTVNATGPSGALVNYTATATDDLDGARPVTCIPAAGQFAIGATTVACTATDTVGNTANASFVVTVRGASDQLTDLRTAVDGIGPGYSLINKISDVQAALLDNDVPGACSILSAFVNEVQAQSGKKIPAGTAASLVADATRIRAVLAC
ncbi:MAG TPA: HYR domain-containing protein, partial [Solirubrobacter sp.]|nr:HYR domain-containing protein [Solirubrobacter sp.]